MHGKKGYTCNYMYNLKDYKEGGAEIEVSSDYVPGHNVYISTSGVCTAHTSMCVPLTTVGTH